MLRAALYSRVSKDKSESRSVAEQNQAGRDAARENGWTLAAEYAETVSASRYTRRERPEWNRLQSDISAGRYGVVILWESSRGSRRLTNWSAFLDSCRQTGTKVHVVSQGVTYDLSKPQDWRVLASEGISSVTESDMTSLRMKRVYINAVAEGRPLGRIPHGYARRYDPATRAAEQYPDDHAPLVAEVVGRIAASEAISRIVADLAARGIVSPTGRPRWSRSSVIGLVSVTYLGMRRGPDGALINANWPAIVAEDVYWAAVAVLADPARKRQADGRGGIRPGRVRWLLSYVATCAKCGAPLNVQMRRVPMYRCSSSAGGCAYAPVEWLDWLVSAAIVAWCSRPAIFEVLTAVDSSESVSARGEAQSERERLASFEAQAVAGSISAESFAVIARGIERRITELEKVANEAGVSPALRDLLRDAEQSDDRARVIGAMWESMPLAVRRSVVRTLCDVTLAPAGEHAADSPWRVRMHWR
jgi:site-specific DNA recombinase